MRRSDPEWQPMQFSELRSRLLEVKKLLEQAAAVSLAQDRAKLEALTELAQNKQEETERGHTRRRRYR